MAAGPAQTDARRYRTRFRGHDQRFGAKTGESRTKTRRTADHDGVAGFMHPLIGPKFA
jgi:hypothetical protein